MQKKKTQAVILDRRRAGILLHPTSLPGPVDNGDFGPNAYHFIDFLLSCGISVWQMLPLVPTHNDGSPYMGVSVLAGNPKLISIELLRNWGWLLDTDLESQSGDSQKTKHKMISCVLENFDARTNQQEKTHRQSFLSHHQDWLLDYALFQVIRRKYNLQSWVQWPQRLRDRDGAELKIFQEKHNDEINYIIFEQYVFFKQFELLKLYANEKGVQIFGDLPIFVAHDSAEVWANREQFILFENGAPRTVAGVPPDYFSETGQRWGNPHYNWKCMRENGFSWWIKRIEVSLVLFDIIRVDHFRGFESYWEIDAKEETAMNGKWKKTPGKALFNALLKHFDSLPFVAEDLGIITAEVDALRENFGWPGMKILQFAFDGNRSNPYLPHNHVENCVVYTGTHDNDTTLSWYSGLDDQQKNQIQHYLAYAENDMPWSLIRCALASSARLAVIPMQDLVQAKYAKRMNTPGLADGNWDWRFDWQQLNVDVASKMMQLNQCYDRALET